MHEFATKIYFCIELSFVQTYLRKGQAFKIAQFSTIEEHLNLKM